MLPLNAISFDCNPGLWLYGIDFLFPHNYSEDVNALSLEIHITFLDSQHLLPSAYQEAVTSKFLSLFADSKINFDHSRELAYYRSGSIAHT